VDLEDLLLPLPPLLPVDLVLLGDLPGLPDRVNLLLPEDLPVPLGLVSLLHLAGLALLGDLPGL